MSANRTVEKLVEWLSDLEIVDAHEHLPREEVRTGRRVDVFNLFNHYTHSDLVTSGMSEETFARIQDTSVPIEERWSLFEPHYENVRFGSYARAAHIALKRFYGFERPTAKNYKDISEAVARENTPGIYRRVLDACKIRCVLDICGPNETWKDDRFTPVMREPNWQPLSVFRQALAEATGRAPEDLESYLGAIDALVERRQAEGVVGLKMGAVELTEPTLAEADRAYRRARETGYENLDAETSRLIGDYVAHHVLDLAGRRNLVVAVHTGMNWNTWGDFRRTHPEHMIPILRRHRATRFDLYHAGIPWARLLGNIVKNFPNAYANLCWCHIISPELTVRTLDEWLDMLPVNKIIGFGGDYSRAVEKIYGHLVMCRENLSRVVGERIERGLLSLDEGKQILKRLLVDNPVEIYRLELPD